MKASRRNFLKSCTAAMTLMHSPFIFSSPIKKSNKKVVWVLLRGAIDSLHTVIPQNDKLLAQYRPGLYKKSLVGAHKITDQFALHAELSNLADWYTNKELLPIVAVSSGYSERSHFDGQDYLESGLERTDVNSGWLARAINEMSYHGIAIQRSIPPTLRGSEQVTSWYPQTIKDASDSYYEQLMSLYEYDETLHSSLSQGLELDEMNPDMTTGKRRGNFVKLAEACGEFLKSESQFNAAMIDFGGWDTHNNQVNRLNNQLKQLDAGLQALKQSLAKEWANTVVIIGTEFGRTVRENGTFGTDHGTASLLLAAGGAIKGGTVLGDWPGLEQSLLHEDRDLKATSNTFSWIAGILQQQWQLSDKAINNVFPGVVPVNHQLIS